MPKAISKTCQVWAKTLNLTTLSIQYSVFSVLAVLAISLSSCAVLPLPEEPPTLIPQEYVPTAVALTAQALVAENATLAENAASLEENPAPKPSFTPQPPSTETATLAPPPTENAPATAEPTPQAGQAEASPTPAGVPASTPEATLPSRIPYGEIQILSPGPLSKVGTPIQINAYLSPGDNSQAWVALFGEDGRLLVRDTHALFAERGYKAHLIEDLDFEIPGAAETARLEISIYDEYGRILALATQDLVLLSTGASDVNLPRDLYEGIVIQQPAPSRLIQGGELVVAGITRYAPGGELHVEVVDAGGEVIASQVIGVSETQLGEGYRPYAGAILYGLGSPTWVRVLVSARDGRMSGLVHVSSVVVLLSP